MSKETAVVTKLRVKEAFIATLVATRRREKFIPGELIIMVDGAELPTEVRFIRLNGLRPGNGLECRYSLTPEELKEKTETFTRPQ